MAASTLKTCRSATNRFTSFCTQSHLVSFPVSEQVLCYLVARLFHDDLSGRTVKSYLSGVRYSQIALGLGDPQIHSMPKLEYIVKGCRRLQANPSSIRLPITPDILRKLKGVWESHPSRGDAKMLWAAACMCFFGFLRSGEVTIPSDKTFDPQLHLTFGDVLVDSTTEPSYIQVKIKASKTDPFRKGVSVYLGRTHQEICPVAAILSFMVYRGSDSGTFFRYGDGRPLTYPRFVSSLRDALTIAGVDSKRYAGHSFRIGAATTAARQGIPDSLIKTLGRWESSAYTLYIRTPPQVLYSVSQSLMRESPTLSGYIQNQLNISS